MITLLAIVPHEESVISGSASAIDGAVCVAPNSIAFSRLNSTGSIAADLLGAGQPGALDGVGADAADPDDRDDVARR